MNLNQLHGESRMENETSYQMEKKTQRMNEHATQYVVSDVGFALIPFPISIPRLDYPVLPSEFAERFLTSMRLLSNWILISRALLHCSFPSFHPLEVVLWVAHFSVIDKLKQRRRNSATTRCRHRIVRTLMVHRTVIPQTLMRPIIQSTGNLKRNESFRPKGLWKGASISKPNFVLRITQWSPRGDSQCPNARRSDLSLQGPGPGVRKTPRTPRDQRSLPRRSSLSPQKSQCRLGQPA